MLSPRWPCHQDSANTLLLSRACSQRDLITSAGSYEPALLKSGLQTAALPVLKETLWGCEGFGSWLPQTLAAWMRSAPQFAAFPHAAVAKWGGADTRVWDL